MKRLVSLFFAVFVAGALVLIVGAFPGCGGGGGGGGEDDPEFFRVVNAAYDAEILHVSLGEEPIRIDVDYGQSSVYTEVPEGTLAVRVRKEDEVLPSVAADLGITAGGDFTYLVTQDEEEVLSGTLITDNNEPAKAERFKIRFINAGKNTAVDFYITNPGDDVDGLPASGTNIGFKAASAYSEIDPGIYRIHVTETGDNDDLLESDDVLLETGKVYTVVFIEREGGGEPFEFLFLGDN